MDGASKASPDWRAALRSLAAALAEAPVADLLEAQEELAALQADVAQRAAGPPPSAALERKAAANGVEGPSKASAKAAGGPLDEAMRLAGERATGGRLSADIVGSLIAGMAAKVRVQVDDVGFADMSVSVSARGEWSLHGQSHKIIMAVTECERRHSKGRIEVGGLNFTAAGDLSRGSFAEGAEAAAWVGSASGVSGAAASDVTRAVVAALEVLVRKKARGVADVDVLKLAFDLMKKEAGVSTPAPARRRMMGKRSVQSEPLAASVVAEDVEGQEAADFTACQFDLASERERGGVSAMPRGIVLRSHDALAAKGTSAASGDAEPEEEEEAEDESQASDEEAKRDEDSPDDGLSQDGEGSAAVEGDGSEDGGVEAKASGGADDDDDCAEAIFAGEKSLKALREKVEGGGAVVVEDLLRALDVESLAEDDDMVPLDASLLPSGFDQDVLAAVKALAKERGALEAAKLLLAAADATDAAVDDDEEGEEEEEDGEEEEAKNEEEEEGDARDESAGPPAKRQKK